MDHSLNLRSAIRGPRAHLDDARGIYSRFRALPGSDWIAKPAAIAGLIHQISVQRPLSILEIGAGIGTLTFTILAALRALSHDAHVVSIEHDPFCLEALRSNLGEDLAAVDLKPSTAGLAARGFDLVVVDGGTLERGAYAEFAGAGGLMMVEGFRSNQRSAIMAAGRPFAITEVWFDDPKDGSYWLIRLEPTTLDRVRYAAGRHSRAASRRLRRLVSAGRPLARSAEGRSSS